MERHISQEQGKTRLELQFEEIVSRLKAEALVHVELGLAESKQYKFAVDDCSLVERNIVALGGTVLQYPVEQIDHYYLEPDQSPSFLTEALCWRQEKPYVEYPRIAEAPEQAALIYKTNPFNGSTDNKRRSLSLRTSDDATMLELLEQVKDVRNGSDFTPYQVTKRRTIYGLRNKEGVMVRIHADRDVILGNQTYNAEQGYIYDESYVGDFVEISLPQDHPEHMLRDVKTWLGIEGELFDVPYIDKARFTAKHVSERPSHIVEIDANDEWLGSEYKPCYFDAARGFVIDIDPVVMRARPDGVKQYLRELVKTISEDLASSNGGRDLQSTNSGSGGGSSIYEKFPGKNMFKKYPSIDEQLAYRMLYRRKTDERRGFARIVFSVVEFINGNKGIFIHLASDYKGYELWKQKHINSGK